MNEILTSTIRNYIPTCCALPLVLSNPSPLNDNGSITEDDATLSLRKLAATHPPIHHHHPHDPYHGMLTPERNPPREGEWKRERERTKVEEEWKTPIKDMEQERGRASGLEGRRRQIRIQQGISQMVLPRGDGLRAVSHRYQIHPPI